MRAIRIASIAASLVIATAVGAHTDEELEKRRTPNGGQLRMAGDYHIELVLVRDSVEPKDNPVTVYVTDHADQKLDTKGATGSVTLLGKNSKATISLKPDGDNRLRGVGRYASEADIKAVVSVTMAGKKSEQARFTPFARGVAAIGKPTAERAQHKH